MSDKVTISVFELFRLFPDQETARLYMEGRIWAKGVKCPCCSEMERITTRKDGFYRCNACKMDFTVRTGTIFERSHIPLHKWLYAMYLLVTARKGISSLQLAKEIGVTQKSAWFMLQRLREACGNDDMDMLRGIVEIDETYIGGKEKNKHEEEAESRSRQRRQDSGPGDARAWRPHQGQAREERIRQRPAKRHPHERRSGFDPAYRRAQRLCGPRWDVLQARVASTTAQGICAR